MHCKRPGKLGLLSPFLLLRAENPSHRAGQWWTQSAKATKCTGRIWAPHPCPAHAHIYWWPVPSTNAPHTPSMCQHRLPLSSKRPASHLCASRVREEKDPKGRSLALRRSWLKSRRQLHMKNRGAPWNVIRPKGGQSAAFILSGGGWKK